MINSSLVERDPGTGALRGLYAFLRASAGWQGFGYPHGGSGRQEAA